MMWIDKYKPKLIEIPHKDQIKQIVDCIKQKVPALIVGQTGVGKTSIVHAIAKELGYDLLEINASDNRDAASLDNLLGNSLRQMSLFMKPRLLFVDEIDGLSGMEDRGGVNKLAELLEKPNVGIIMAANSIEDDKFKKIKKLSQIINFEPIQKNDIITILEKICNKEQLIFDKTTLSSLARRCNGDLRAALIDLQVSSAIDNRLNIMDLDDREPTDAIQTAMLLIFKTRKIDICYRAFDNVDLDLNECILWMDQNIPEEYLDPMDLHRAYNALSKADIFRGRIMKWQYWRFLVYQSFYLTAGVALAKEKKYERNVRYKRTSRLLFIWMANQRNMKKKSIAVKLSSNVHRSIRSTIKDFNYYKRFILNESIMKELELSDDEIIYLNK